MAMGNMLGGGTLNTAWKPGWLNNNNFQMPQSPFGPPQGGAPITQVGPGGAQPNPMMAKPQPGMVSPMGQKPMTKEDDFNFGGGDGSSGTSYGLNDRSNGGGFTDTSPPSFGNDGGLGTNDPSNTGLNPSGGGTTPFNLANGGGSGFNLNQAGGYAAAAATAYQQWRQSRQYTDYAERYADQLDPFGKQRGQYQTMLSDSYTNPQGVLSGAPYQQQLHHGLDSVARTGASKGYLGSGNMETALEDYAHNSDQDYLNNYRQGLMPLTGAQFGPAASGHMLETGLMGRMNSENAALGSLFYPFGNSAQGGQNSGGGGTDWVGDAIKIAGMALPFLSDRRLKSNVRFLGNFNGNKWYRYNIGGIPSVGVMADEVNQDAVSTHWSGYKMVDYTRI